MKKIKKHNYLVLLLFNLFFYYTNSSCQIDTIIYIDNTAIAIAYSKVDSSIGNILVLPGWNYSFDDICKKSNFCDVACLKGYNLIMPDMQKSVYHSKIFNETRADWVKYPTRFWLINIVFPYLQQNLQLLLPTQNNYLFGISTGGRGVALIAAETKDIFKAGAALSGDFNQIHDTTDKLMIGYYGSYSSHKDRWKYVDNPTYLIEKISIPLYIAHGQLDKVVSYKQSVYFYNNLKMRQPDMQHHLEIITEGKHDYTFWQSLYSKVFQFFCIH